MAEMILKFSEASVGERPGLRASPDACYHHLRLTYLRIQATNFSLVFILSFVKCLCNTY